MYQGLYLDAVPVRSSFCISIALERALRACTEVKVTNLLINNPQDSRCEIDLHKDKFGCTSAVKL